MKTTLLLVGIAVLMMALGGCGGSTGVTPVIPPINPPAPEQIRVEVPLPTPSGVISLVGVQRWTLVGDTPNRPVELVCLQTDAIALNRVSPGIWEATALSSWQADVALMVNGSEVSRVHVVTTHIIPDKLEILVEGATKVSDAVFDGGIADYVSPVTIKVTWIDHYASGYPGWPGSPDIPVLWTVPEGLVITVLGDKARQIEVRSREGFGPQTLVGDVAGKKFTVLVQTGRG
ncbi:MAG: hypothetical protein NTZ65_00230 [Candidatus Berkelbacteria bacterium]|nr:hypothetical protein [Candidatus Berkelbacteria bacterium]